MQRNVHETSIRCTTRRVLVAVVAWMPLISSAAAPIHVAATGDFGVKIRPASVQPTTARKRVAPRKLRAADCGFDAVQKTLEQAQSGAVILIPAGDCDWGDSQLTVRKNVHLRGESKAKTILRRTQDVPSARHLITVDCASGAKASISDMTLAGRGYEYTHDKGLGLVNTCIDFKVWRMRLTGFSFAGVEVIGDAARQRGVIFQSDFINNYNANLRNLGYAVVVFGDGSWPGAELGTANSVFVEDNYMVGNRHAIASNNGARYVFRHNTVVGEATTRDFPLIDAHGLDYHPRGTRQFEIYENRVLSADAKDQQSALVRSAINVRGGTGVIFNNHIGRGISRSVELDIAGAPCGTYPAPDQLHDLHIWNNTSHDDYGYTSRGVANNCPDSIGQNRDYFLHPKRDYRPYPYPHSLR